MKSVKTIVAIGLVIISCLVYSAVKTHGAESKNEKQKLRVGTFDSRAVAVAYAGSKEFNQEINKLMEEHKKAKADGDEKKVKELEFKGQEGQVQFHMQGFSTASVSNILEHIKDQIPGIAKQAGVDVVVSKWDVVYQATDAEFVDVTDKIIKPFHPSEKTLKIVSELKKHAPIPLEEAKNIKD